MHKLIVTTKFIGPRDGSGGLLPAGILVYIGDRRPITVEQSKAEDAKSGYRIEDTYLNAAKIAVLRHWQKDVMTRDRRIVEAEISTLPRANNHAYVVTITYTHGPS